MLVEDFTHLVMNLDTETSANLAVKFQGSVSQAMPDFAAAQTKDNPWDYVAVKDLEDGSAIDGDTGLAFAGTDDHRLLEANVNGLRWFCAVVTARAAGAVTVLAKPFEAGSI